MSKMLVQDLAEKATPETELKLYDHRYSDDPFIIASAEAILNEWIFNGAKGLLIREFQDDSEGGLMVDVDRGDGEGYGNDTA